MMKLGKAYYHRLSPWQLARDALLGLRMTTRPEALIYGYSQLLKCWTVLDRLDEIKGPTLVLAGRDDFQFPPEHQATLAAGIANARLEIIERAGHNAPTERSGEVIQSVRRFLSTSGVAYDAIDAYLEKERRRLKMPAVSLAIVEGDRIVHQRGFGQTRVDGDAASPQTPFFHASAKMTVRHLLNQTSGLSTLAGEIQLADFDDSPGAAERQARALSTLELSHPVGTAFEYSNANYNLLGLIIEAASCKAAVAWGTNPDFAGYMALLPEQKKGVVLLFSPSRLSKLPPLPPRCDGYATGARILSAAPALHEGRRYSSCSRCCPLCWVSSPSSRCGARGEPIYGSTCPTIP